MNTSRFYYIQLIVLTVVCLFLLLIDRYVSKRRQGVKESTEDRLENGKGSTNSLAVLTRQYLVVYAIVMGKCILLPYGRLQYLEPDVFNGQAPTGSKVPTCILYTEINTSSAKALSRSCL